LAAACLAVWQAAFVAAAEPNAPIHVADFKPPIRVACIGDSITEGVGADGGWAWPCQLDRMLDETWDVRNFGKSYSQALRSARRPYWGWPEFQRSRIFCADVVVIVLGTNDAAAVKDGEAKDFARDYKALVLEYQRLPSKPRIFCCTPPWAVGREGNYQLVIPIIEGIAKEMNCGLIDLYAPFQGKKDLLPDGLHPNTAGATVLAKTLYKALTGKEWEGAVPSPIAVRRVKTPIPFVENPGELSYRDGFGLIAAIVGMPAEKLDPIRQKFEESAPLVEAKILEIEETIRWYDAERMRFKHSKIEEEQKLYGEYKAKVAETKAALEKDKRDRLNELIRMTPEPYRGGFASAWAAKYVFDRLAPIAATLTVEQMAKVREHCHRKGDALGRINNTPERSIEHIETYKEVYQQILTDDQRRRVEPR
jgi:lysophospholipase L1-like esterase